MHWHTEKKTARADAVTDCLTLLPLSLVDRFPQAASFIRGVMKKRRMGIGWHYLLDLIWIVERVRHLPENATILDAGAGGGLLQYVLVDMGYRVLSVDFAPRPSPRDVNCIKIAHQIGYQHSYLDHLAETYKHARKESENDKPLRVESCRQFVGILENKDVDLVLYQSDISDMRLCPDNAVDAVVSLSVFEHMNHTEVLAAVTECLRVLKPGRPFLATTSAANEDDWYHDASMGWCFSEKSLRDLFGLADDVPSNADQYDQIMADIKRPGNVLNRELADFYYRSGNNGMPWGIWNPEYIPVGICKIKNNPKDSAGRSYER
ncbi:hypothetical protein JCM14469_05140 [Desulfatiferula olefinivorans]